MIGQFNGKRVARSAEILNAFHGDVEVATHVMMAAKNELTEIFKELRELTARSLKVESSAPISLRQAIEVHLRVARMGEIARVLQASDLLASLRDIEGEMNRSEVRLDVDFARVQNEAALLISKMDSFLKLTSL